MSEVAALYRYPDLVRFTSLCDEITNNRNGRNYAALKRRIYDQMTPFADERDRLRDRLDRGLTWLQEHPDDPAHAEREERWLTAWLPRYEAICDALEQARKAVQ